MKELTSSSLATFRTCPRKYYFSYIKQRVKASDTPAQAFGKIFHRVLATRWKYGMTEAIDWLNKNAEAISVEDMAKTCALLAHYNPPFDQYAVIGVEVPFEMKIENPDGGRAFYGYRLLGKIDLLLRRLIDGETVICDHKTTSQTIEGFGAYWQGLQIDAQMNNYCAAHNAKTFIYDAIHKPGIKLCGADRKDAESRGITEGQAYRERCESDIVQNRDKYFQWREYPRTAQDMLEARRDLWQWVEQIRACDNDDRFPRNCSSCKGFFGACQYVDVCSGSASLDDDSMFRTKEQANEELLEDAI